MQQRISINDIAEMAGVSIATVSRVLNNRGNVKDSTRSEVYAAMRRLNYRMPAVSTTSARRDILMLVPNIGNPFYARILDGAQDVAAQRGYNILLMQSTPNGAADGRSCLPEGIMHFAGFLLLQSASSDDLEQLKQLHIPFVQCSEYTEGREDISYVSINDELAAKKATEYLLALGRRKIAFFNSVLSNQYAVHREKGFMAALEQAGIEANPQWVYHFPEVSFDIALSTVQQLFKKKEIPNAVFAVSDVFAAAAIKGAKREGLRVPEDVAVVGFDNVEISTMLHPAITTVSQPRYQLGSAACGLLLDQIEKPDSLPQQLLLDTQLIVRESSMV